MWSPYALLWRMEFGEASAYKSDDPGYAVQKKASRQPDTTQIQIFQAGVQSYV